jgi:hypothetical protein
VQTLGKFSKAVQDLLIELINPGFVRVRVTHDGNHVMVYPDDDSRPFKLSASRDSTDSVKYLRRWGRQRGYFT